MKLLNYVLLTTMLNTSPLLAQSETWAVGGVVGTHSGLSLHHAVDQSRAYHFAGSYSETELFFSGDLQQHILSPLQWHSEWPIYLYGGLGISGEHAADSKTGEKFFLRLPLGGQWNISALHMQVFAEAAGLLGEIPETNISAELRGGIRAYF